MNKLWDSQVWGGAGRSDILHYLLFFNVGDGRIDTISEAEYRWKPNLSVAQKKACLDAIDKVKYQVASHGLLITEALHDKLNDASKALRCPFFEVQVPYGTPRSVDHSWQSVAIGELLQRNTLVHDIFADTELSKLSYTIQQYGAISYYLAPCVSEGWALDDYVYISFFIMPNNESDSCVILSKTRISDLDREVVWLYYFKKFYEYKSFQLKIQATKVAIGSIMSRNGSHNIGSHVLAALSHNVGTMPDDRELYQYIQQRMDYIATATTDFPSWRQPTMLVSGVMREFLIQRHLLNHIAGSEGLQAYQFQNRSLPPNQKRAIRIHVRRIRDEIANWANDGCLTSLDSDDGQKAFSDDGKKVVSFIKYDGGDDHALRNNKDIAVAIPGGVVGQHAFYTILENVIRNAAKHDWAKVAEGDRQNANLELYIDFRDNPKEGIVECRVWTCVVKQENGVSEIIHSQGDFRGEKSICEEVAHKIRQSFIDKDGSLRKENWGIAEMRISAGYLRNCDIADIGGLNNDKSNDAANGTLKILCPVEVALPDGGVALGYRFDLYKPRELLIVLPESCTDSDADIERANKNANQYGVWLKRENDLIQEKDLSFSYVLFDVFDVDSDYGAQLPFRIMANRVVASKECEEGIADEKQQGAETVEYAKRLIPEIPKPIFRYSGTPIEASDVIKLATEATNAQDLCNDFLEHVYGIWISHVLQSPMDKNHPLAIDVVGRGGEKKSLVTKVDLLRFVLENSFNAAVRPFLKFGFGAYNPKVTPKNTTDELFDKTVNDLIAMTPRAVALETVAAAYGRTLGQMTPTELLEGQIQEWFCTLYGISPQSLCQYNDFRSSHGYVELINYICGPILGQAEVFLAKYEEDYSTLPPGFKIEVEKTDGEWPVPAQCGQQTVWVDYSKRDGCICYLRHSLGVAGDIHNYLEPLSGSQSYLGEFLALRDKLSQGGNSALSIHNKQFIVSLIENASFRMLIIDERVKDFMDRHDEVRNKLGGLGVAVKGDNDSEVIQLFAAINAGGTGQDLEKALATPISGVALKDFEILIVHQGIIDKLLNGHEDVQEVAKFLQTLIARMRYVVIATGRGSPANIPDEARVLPYSVIKDTLLKCYPEKMILVGAIMNILPLRHKQGV